MVQQNSFPFCEANLLQYEIIKMKVLFLFLFSKICVAKNVYNHDDYAWANVFFNEMNLTDDKIDTRSTISLHSVPFHYNYTEPIPSQSIIYHLAILPSRGTVPYPGFPSGTGKSFALYQATSSSCLFHQSGIGR